MALNRNDSKTLQTGADQQFSLWTRWGLRVRVPGLQEVGFARDVGRVLSPGGGWQGHNENSWAQMDTDEKQAWALTSKLMRGVPVTGGVRAVRICNRRLPR